MQVAQEGVLRMISKQKYMDIAHQNPRGKLALTIIEANWTDWIETVGKYKRENLELEAEQVAKEIFWECVWGFGVDNWSEKTARACLRKYTSSTGGTTRDYPDICLVLDFWLEKIFFREATKITNQF